MIHQNRLRIFIECLDNYKQDIPLSKYLKEFFKRNKQMGSRDRKSLSHMVYAYYRIGNLGLNYSVEERLMMALLLVANDEYKLLSIFKPEWEEHQQKSTSEKLAFLNTVYPELNSDDIFPLKNMVSSMLNVDEFLNSHFIQPDLFLRAVKGKEERLRLFLEAQNISFVQEGNCFRLHNSTKIEEPQEYLYEVQDKSSQETLKMLSPKADEYWWDCCSASGGKSLLLKELEPNAYLMCSDNRESILSNLDERFKKAGITKYKRRLIDLKAEIHSFEPETFDGIILDAPCTGSGTWSRTPERIVQVEEKDVKYFSELQYSIAENAIQFLKKGKHMLYITCSIFAKENEEVIARLHKTHQIKVEEMRYIEGYGDKADTMFVALIGN